MTYVRVAQKIGKYRNRKVAAFGKKFDSILERNRYFFLQEAEREGKIKDLRTQVRFEIEINGARICAYIADFTYFLIKPLVDGMTLPKGSIISNVDECLIYVVEDTKGVLTPEFKIKAKLLQAVHGIEIMIVRRPTDPI